MKLTEKLKTLILLTLTVTLLQSNCFAQGKPLKCVTITRYDSLLIAVAEDTEAIIQAQTYKALSDTQSVEIDRKEAVIVSQINKNKISYRLIDTLKMQGRLKDEIITTQASTIKRLGTKPKHWGVGLVVGYGYGFGSEVKRVAFAGVAVTRTLFRF